MSRLRPTNAKHLSLEGHSLLINYLDFRMIVGVQKRHGDLPAQLRHHELLLWDLLFDAATALNLVQSVTPGWRRHEQREPKLRHGHHIFLESEQARIDAAVAISTEKEPVASAMATLASPSSQPLPNISGPPVSTPARVGASSANPASDVAHFTPLPSPATPCARAAHLPSYR